MISMLFQAELIKVEENVATIFLPRSEMEMVWEKQLKDIIVVAGFEIYDAEINSPLYFHQTSRYYCLTS